MRDPDEGNGFVNCHVPAVDIACPHIADALFAFKIILSDTFHRDRGIFKMFYLSLRCVLALSIGIQNHKDQHSNHNEHVNNNDHSFFHNVFRS